MKGGQSGRKDSLVLESKEYFQTISIFSQLTEHSMVSNSSERLSKMKAEKCRLNVMMQRSLPLKSFPSSWEGDRDNQQHHSKS